MQRKNGAGYLKLLISIDFYSDNQILLRKIYTAMYHMNIQPRNRTDDHGTWDDFHTIWDSWKTVFPFYSLFYPQKMGAIIDSMIDRAKKNQREGKDVVLCDSYLSGLEYPAGQGGNDVDNVIVDAYLKGVPLEKYTWNDAYEVLLQSASLMRSPEYIEKGYATSNNVMKENNCQRRILHPMKIFFKNEGKIKIVGTNKS